MWVRPWGWEDPLEAGMATHPSILAWRIPGTEEPTAQRVAEESDTTEAAAHTQKTTRLFLLDNQKVMRLHFGS